MTTFEIHDPKKRTITVAPFRDQVVHHALIHVLEPIFERRMVAHSYACRRGKGTLRALRHARTMLRRHPWFLKLDVASFFASVEHGVAMAAAERLVKDKRLLRLLSQIVAGPSEPPSLIGLPLGFLTSQWLANLVLDPLDHWILEQLHIAGYVRYMDDLVLFGPDRATLREAREQVEAYLAEKLHLRLKERATVLSPSAGGLPFLGWMLYPGAIRLRPENLRRYRWRLRQRRRQWALGQRSTQQYREGVASLFDLLEAGGARALKRRWANEPWPDL